MNRILVVDDKEEILRALRILLERNGYAVDTAIHGAEALAIARLNPPQLIISDLLMPVMDGYTLLRNWKADDQLRQIPFIVHTATYTDPREQRLALDMGANAFILKPVASARMLKCIQDVMLKEKRNEPAPAHAPDDGGNVLLNEYTEVLFRKLEEKTSQLEQSNRALQEDLNRRRLAEVEAKRHLRDTERARTALLSILEDQRQTQSALREKEYLLSESQRIAHIGSWLWELNGGLVCSDEVYRIYGVTPEAFNQESFLNLIHPDDRPAMQAWATSCLAGEIPGALDFRALRPDGTIRFLSSRGEMIYDSARRPTHVTGTTQDITERKRVEDELRASEANLAAAQEHAHFGSWELDLVTSVSTWSAETFRLLHRNPALGAPTLAEFLELVHPEDRPGIEIVSARINETTGTIVHEYRTNPALGPMRHLSASLYVTRDATGRAVKAAGVALDITDRKQAESTLRQSEERHRLLFEASPQPICVYDKVTLAFLAVNDTFVRQYGYSRAEMLAMTIMGIVPPDDVPAVLQRINTGLDDSFEPTYWQHVRRDGSIIDVEIRARSMEFNGSPSRFALVSDITEQRRTEAMLTNERAVKETMMTRLNHLLSTSPSILYNTRLGATGVVPLWVSDNITAVLGYSVEEALRPDWWPNHLLAADRDKAIAEARELQENKVQTLEYRFVTKQGDVRWIVDEARLLDNRNGESPEVVGTWIDITQRRHAEERQRLDATAIQASKDGMLITDATLTIVSVNKALCDLSGYAEGELLGAKTSILKSGRHDASFYQAMWLRLEKTGQWHGEIWNRSKDGAAIPLWLSISAVYDAHAEASNYIGIYTDLSEIKRTEQELEHLAHYDPLTHLPNRLLLQSRLAHAIAQAERLRARLGVMFIDLDEFKRINDSLGHVVGDQLLTEVAQRLSGRIRKGDTLARLGGDEFVVLLESIPTPDGAATVARDLLAVFSEPFLLPGGRTIFAQASIGISIYPDDGTSMEELLRDADAAMYRAKAEGRNQFLFFTADMSVEALAQLEVETALRQARERGELTLHYQPKVDLVSGRMTGAEALLRWRRADGSFTPPARFIPVAEKSDLIISLGEWVIDEACRQIRFWLDAGFTGFTVAINVSARQFRSKNLDTSIRKALSTNRVPPECLTLELTESMLIERPDDAIARLTALKSMGVSLSLDDFGTGFSSLAYLIHYPIDVLKIDRTFVNGIGTTPGAEIIVDNVIDLAHSLHLRVVAEGVETAVQLEYLRNRGCNEIQGYYFSRPVPPGDFAALLLEGKSLAAAEHPRTGLV